MSIKLRGPKGDKGDSAYQVAIAYTPFRGTAKQWIESLKGDKVEFRKTDTHIQYKHEGSAAWENLVLLNDLIGPPGTVTINTIAPSNPTEGLLWIDIS